MLFIALEIVFALQALSLFISQIVKVLDANGNILTSGQVAPGGNLYFSLTGNERQVQEIYHMGSGAYFIIISEIPPL